MRVLVIEDDDRMRAAVRRALMLGGYEVVEAVDGPGGRRLVAAERPDGVVLDLGLPGLDGMEVCRRLRAQDDGLPILMLTARDAIEDRVDGLEAGADDYLVKPYDVRELLARTKAMMRRSLVGEDRTPRFAELELDAGQHAVNAAVDIWHCNASGIYSDIESESTLGYNYLRGVQFTDRHGQVTFKSIFPGHYAGRTTHVHARIHINSKDQHHKLTAGHICHTGQVFPSETAYTEVYALSPYNAETATVVTHAEDRVWTDQHGYTEPMRMSMIGSRLSKGLIGKVTMAVNPKATPKLIGATSTGTSATTTTGAPPTGTAPTSPTTTTTTA